MSSNFGSGADSSQKAGESQKLEREIVPQADAAASGNHGEHLGRPGF
jgi:hypothetical protein